MGQGNPTLGPEYFRHKLGRASFLTNYSGPRVGFPCPTTIHMKDTLNPSSEGFLIMLIQNVRGKAILCLIPILVGVIYDGIIYSKTPFKDLK